MEINGLVGVTLLVLLFRSSFAFPFASNKNGGSAREDARSCTCNAVEFWLRRKTDSSSELALPSFEELTPSREAYHRSYENGRRLRLRPRGNCKLLLKKAEGSNKLTSVKIRNIHDGSIEVWLAKNGSDCLSFWMKCEEESICVGVDVDSTDSFPSTKRKLLMIANGDEEEKNAFQSYSFLLTGFVLCAMVILIALCGSNPRKSEIYCPENEDVQVVSSTKIKSLRPNDPSLSEDVAKSGNEKALAKKAEAGQVVADKNSNRNEPSGFEDVALDGDENPSTNGRDAMDGQVFGKIKEGKKKEDKEGKKKEDKEDKKKQDKEDKKKEDKEGKKKEDKEEKKKEDKEDKKKEDKEDKKKEDKEGKKKEDKEEKKKQESKRKDKNMRSKRSDTAPETETDPQAKASRGFSSKLRISLKSHSSIENDKKSQKKRKNKSETENLTPPSSPTTPLGFGQIQGRDRRSFIDRELPQRPPDDVPRVLPTDENNYAEPFDAEHRPYATSEEMKDDETYEQVINNKTGDAPVSAKEEIRRNTTGAAAGQRISMKGDPDDLYDSVDDKRITTRCVSAGALPLDPYEAVGGSMKGKGTLPDDFYEVVDKSKRNTLEIYEEPNALGRKRSFSDISGNPLPSTESEKKSKSLERGIKFTSQTPPEPPPLEDLQNVARLRQASHEDEKALIDPYTMTVLKGDYILQETSTKDVAMQPTAKQAAVQFSQEELEEMYAKVDKEKQKRDRLESQAGKDGNQEEEGVDGAETETNTVDKPSSNGDDDEHDYEAVFDKKDVEEVIVAKL